MAVKIKRMTPLENSGKVKAFFAVSLGPLDIDDCRLIDGKNGLFVGLPSKKATIKGEETFVPIVSLSKGTDGAYTASAAKLANEILEAAKAEYARRGGEVESSSDEDDDLPF